MSADQISRCPRPLCDGTFREFFEIGVDEDGEFMVDYRGNCRDCGLSHSFRAIDTLDLTVES